MEHWTTSSEFFEVFLVEMNDQIFDSNGLIILTVALRFCFLVVPEDHNRLAESLICLHRDLLRRISQRDSGYTNFLART